jgi:hypothetical protein
VGEREPGAEDEKPVLGLARRRAAADRPASHDPPSFATRRARAVDAHAAAVAVTTCAARSHDVPKAWTRATRRGKSGLTMASGLGTNASPPGPRTVVGCRCSAMPRAIRRYW